MAKGWKTVGNINGLVQSDETARERQRRFNKADSVIKTMKPITDDYEYKKHLDDTYAKAIAYEDHLIDVVDNNRTTNKEIIDKVKKIKSSRAKAEKRKGEKNDIQNSAENKS